MKVIGIQTSPNHDGLTAISLKETLSGASKEKTEIINLNDHIIKKCKACENGWGQCRREGKCILVDEFQEIREKIRNSDALVFATPVYWHDVSESAKTFLDRLRRCETVLGFKSFKKIKAIGITSAGGSGNGAIRALFNLEDYLKRIGFNIFDLVNITQKNKYHKLPMLKNAGERLISKN